MENTVVYEKIEKINSLKYKVTDLENFLRVMNMGNKISKYQSDKKDRFSTLELGGYFYTGDDNPKYSVELRDEETINEIVEVSKSTVEAKIKKLNKELEELIK